MQKHTALRLNPGQLIDDGLFARVRNINYFGELLINLSFAVLSMHVLPFLVAAAYVFFVRLPNMRRKDRSLSRHEGFDANRSRSSLFLSLLY